MSLSSIGQKALLGLHFVSMHTCIIVPSKIMLLSCPEIINIRRSLSFLQRTFPGYIQSLAFFWKCLLFWRQSFIAVPSEAENCDANADQNKSRSKAESSRGRKSACKGRQFSFSAVCKCKETLLAVQIRSCYLEKCFRVTKSTAMLKASTF